MDVPESQQTVTRVRRPENVPQHLLDYDLSGPGSIRRVQAPAPPQLYAHEYEQEHEGEEEPSSGSVSPVRPIEPVSQPMLPEATQLMQEDPGDTSQNRPLPNAPTSCQQTHQTDIPLSNQSINMSELVAVVQEVRQQNATLQQQFQSLMAEFRAPSHHAAPMSSQRLTTEAYSHPTSRLTQTPASQYGDPYAQRHSHHYAVAGDHAPLQSSQQPRANYVYASPHPSFPGVDQYGQGTQVHSSHTPYDSRHDSMLNADPRYTSYRSRHMDMPPIRETTYRGPKATIPCMTSPDPRQFSRMKTALENILPEDATERYKYQILTDHLKCEEALLVADSYVNSRHPYTDTMLVLIKMYGQPHKLALQRISEVMDGPRVRTGDVKAFNMFALQVRSLVGMLEQLGKGGNVELLCGSHVSRLLSKLPYDLNYSFKRYIYPRKVEIPTLVDFAEWLEFELEMQEDNGKSCSVKNEEPHNKRRDHKRESKLGNKTTTVLLGTESTAKHSTSTTPSAVEPSANKSSKEQKVKAYCPYCENDKHFLNSCANFKELSKDQKVSWIKGNNRCWRCGRGHQAAKCTLKAPCKTCNRRHLLVLHEVNERTEDGVQPPAEAQAESYLTNTTSKVLYADRPTYDCKVLLKISKVIIRNGSQSMEAYAVLDDGSERTILLHSAVQELGLIGKPEKLALRTVRQELHVLHGAAVSFTISPASEPKRRYKIQNAFSAEQLGLAQHTHPVSILQQRYKHLAGLPLQSLNQVHPMLLIGSDYTHLITPIEPVRLGPPGGPAAVRTLLGWTLQGPAQAISLSHRSQQCLFTSAASTADLFSCVEKLWQLDVIPYRSEKVVIRSRQDQEAMTLLQEQTVRVEVSGVKRYATPLLRVKSMPRLHASPEAVLPHLRGIERRLTKLPEQAAAYQAEIRKLEDAGYAVKLESHQIEGTEEAWYIPHHIVRHNGKNRVVYNCSFQHQGLNLNDFLLPGPALGSSLLAVLLRFRQHAVAFSSDVRAMFHQVRLLPSDRPLLRFLWRDLNRDRPPDVYEWQVLPFGTTCSPCCATYALQRHVHDNTQPEEEVRSVIDQSFYVDNCLHSLTSRVAARALVDRLQHLLAEGGFELRQWASNDPSIISHLPSNVKSTSGELWLSHGQLDVQESALGLHWNCKSDTLSYKIRRVEYSVVTMRNIYKVLASQYDPLGYLVPYTTRAKVLVQRLWDKRRDWDDPQLPKELLDSWHSWEAELEHLPEMKLPRCYSTPRMDHPSSTREVHVFCDASELAYGSVAYLRTVDPGGKVEVSFLAARSRVAPRKQQSIPRLELCAALTGAQLLKVIATELTLSINSSTLWSDSLTVLTWLLSDSCRYKVFVGTRVAEIQELTGSASWRYVPTGDNPADDITRGLSLQVMRDNSRWAYGPTFLKSPSAQWPDQPSFVVQEPECELKRATTMTRVLATTTSSLPDPDQHQTLGDYLQAAARQLHGAANPGGPLTADAYQSAEVEVLQQAQRDSFPDEVAQLKAGKPVAKSSRLLLLAPELDESTGLIRVGGRLRHCTDLATEEAHPIVLDPKHPLTRLIIKDYDEKLCHPGPERVFTDIRRRYWVLHGREAVRRHQKSCVTCRQWRGRPDPPRMADLPPSRQRVFKPPFYSAGVDCFGPFVIKIGRRNEKRWGILFKCMTTRAVHLDLLSSIDSDSFLMALRRFIARRGKPYELLCDQGTNFRGGERELRQAFTTLHPELQAELASQQIRFVFNPPAAPHFGGCWEREIRSLKAALRVTIGAQTVSEEVLRTVLVEIEGILNSKPLGYTSSDIADPDPVTPNCLLMGRRDTSLPQVVFEGPETLGRRRWRHSQILADHFWKHFLTHYLPGLQARQKWRTEAGELQVGEVVMIVDNQLPRALWPVGKVVQVFPGADKRIRSAEVAVKDKKYVRPVARLISLPDLPEEK